MTEPEAVGTTVREIMREMAETIANAGGDPGPIDLWDEPPRPAPLPVAQASPPADLIKGGKED